jgi:hypothetical protein
MEHPDKRYTQRLEITVHCLFLILGFILLLGSVLISLDNKSTETIFWSLVFNSISAVLIAVGLTGITTTFFNFGSLNEINDSLNKLIEQWSNSRISCITKREIEKLEPWTENQFHRYFKTWDGNSGCWIWRVRKINFSLSHDKRRVNSKFKNKHNAGDYYYQVQATYVDNHFILIMDDKYNNDLPIIEIYPFAGKVRNVLFSGLGFRQSLPPDEKQLISPCVISSIWINELGDSPKDINTWEASIDQITKLDAIWARNIRGIHFDGLSKIIDDFKLG